MKVPGRRKLGVKGNDWARMDFSGFVLLGLKPSLPPIKISCFSDLRCKNLNSSNMKIFFLEPNKAAPADADLELVSSVGSSVFHKAKALQVNEHEGFNYAVAEKGFVMYCEDDVRMSSSGNFIDLIKRETVWKEHGE